MTIEGSSSKPPTTLLYNEKLGCPHTPRWPLQVLCILQYILKLEAHCKIVCWSVRLHSKGRTHTDGRTSQQNTGRSAQGPSSAIMTWLCEQGSSGSLSFVCAWQRRFDGRVCRCVGRLRGDNATPTSGRGEGVEEREKQQQQQQQLTCCHAPGGLWNVYCGLVQHGTSEALLCAVIYPHAAAWLTGATAAPLRRGPCADFPSLSIMDCELLSF